MRTPRTGFERRSPSSTAVANIVDSAARSLRIAAVESLDASPALP